MSQTLGLPKTYIEAAPWAPKTAHERNRKIGNYTREKENTQTFFVASENYSSNIDPVPVHEKKIVYWENEDTEINSANHEISPNQVHEEEKIVHCENSEIVSANHDYKHYKCGQKSCDQKFKSPKDLKKHNDMVHGGSKNNNKCENCEKVFASYKGLREHIKMIHEKTDYEKFKCFVCGNYFTKMSTLKRHNWSVHHISSKDTQGSSSKCS